MSKDLKVMDLNELMEDEELFYSKLDSLQKTVLKKYKQRKKKMIMRFNNKDYTCTIANFITQMVFMIPFVDMKITPDDSFIILDSINDFNASHSITWANNVINFFDENDYLNNDDDINQLNLSIKKVLRILADLSGECNVLSGTTINIHDLVDLYHNNKEFRDLINQNINDGEFSDIEKEVNEQFDKLMDILRNEDTCFKPYFRSKTGINEKQFKEIISTIALKADLDGTIIPYIIQSNFLKGLNNVTEFYIISILAHKALITSHQRTKDSGYLTRKISMLLIDTMLSEDIDDCETDEYLEVELLDEVMANRFNLRYFLNDDNELERFDTNYHKDLIGKKVLFRSPIKCKCKDGHVCHTCYGDLKSVNKNIHIGLLAVLELTEQLTQKLLSAKHLQQTFASIIEWSNEFMKNFIVDKDSIYVNPDREKSGCFLVFNDDWISEPDEENNFNVSEFIIKSKNGSEITVPSPDSLKLFLSDTSIDLLLNNPVRDKDNRIIVSFKNLLSVDSPVFQFNLENNELTSSLQSIIDLIETADHPDPYEKDEKGKPIKIDDVDVLANKFLQLLSDGDIYLASVHMELIIRELVRSKKDHSSRPERFDNKDDEDEGYDILKISDGIFESKSPSVSLSFEHIKKQIQSPSLYYKNGESILDVLYFQ